MGSHFIWYELITSDADAAAAFYHHVVGWTQRPFEQDPRYRLFSMGDKGIGGLMTLPPDAAGAGMPPSWHAYVSVADVDASVTAITAAGGTVYMPATDVPTVGRMAMVTDPQGAAFYVMTPMGDGPSESFTPIKPGHIGWNELHTSDAEAALRFYDEQLGWKSPRAMDMGPMGSYHFFNTGNGDAVGGIFTDTQFPRPKWLFYINVEDITAAVERVQSVGGVVLNGPHEVPGGQWIIVGHDPQGAMFALVGPKRP